MAVTVLIELKNRLLTLRFSQTLNWHRTDLSCTNYYILLTNTTSSLIIFNGMTFLSAVVAAAAVCSLLQYHEKP